MSFYSVLTLVRKRNCCQRKANCKQITTLLGNLKLSELLVYVHPLPPKDQLCKYICSEADTFYAPISFPTTIYKRNVFGSCLGPKVHSSQYYKNFFFSAVILSSQAEQNPFISYVRKLQRQTNHVLMLTNRVSMGNTDISHKSS